MPLFNVKWDGMGFTSKKKMTEQELSQAQATRLTKKLRTAGQMPQGVVRIVQASVSPDACDGGEWKVFVSVELVVEARSESDAERAQPPVDFLLMVADKMVKGDADAEYGIRDSFEVLEVYASDETPAAPKAKGIVNTVKSVSADKVAAGQWLVYDNARMNQRIVDVSATRDGQIRVEADYGNGGEPATLFFEANERVRISPSAPSA